MSMTPTARLIEAAKAVMEWIGDEPCRRNDAGECQTHNVRPFEACCVGKLAAAIKDAEAPPPGLAGIGRDQLERTIWSNGYPPQISDAGRGDVVTVDPKRLTDAILARIGGGRKDNAS